MLVQLWRRVSPIWRGFCVGTMSYRQSLPPNRGRRRTSRMDTSHIDAWLNSQPGPLGQRVKPHILVADDDAEMRALLTLILQSDGYEVITCADGSRLVEYLKALWAAPSPVNIDLMICDVRMPGLTGLEVLE